MFQINTIVDRFGERFHADRNYVNMQSLQLRDAMPSGGLEYIKTLQDKWKELDAAIIGIGGPSANNKNLIYEFPRAYKKLIQTSGTVGDILSQFFYEDVRILEMDTQYRLLALDINRLRRVKNVIAMATGQDKCRPICAAARLGYIKSLVTDYDTAKYILTSDM
jgi:DNA-binding transcriptional regulator LsrR (DeoR family)